MKFVVTISDRQGPANTTYNGEYEVLGSGVLKITKADGDIEHLSPSGWLWVGQK